jgi:hypothetical protein
MSAHFDAMLQREAERLARKSIPGPVCRCCGTRPAVVCLQDGWYCEHCIPVANPHSPTHSFADYIPAPPRYEPQLSTRAA